MNLVRTIIVYIKYSNSQQYKYMIIPS